MTGTPATVTALQGPAFVRDSAGNIQALKVGMAIPEGAQIITGASHVVQLQVDGVSIQATGSFTYSTEGLAVAAAAATLVPPDDVAAPTDSAVAAADIPPLPHAGATTDADGDSADLAGLMEEDPLELLDPTAAVSQGGEGGAGTISFVQAVTEHTQALDMAFAKPGAAPSHRSEGYAQGDVPSDAASNSSLAGTPTAPPVSPPTVPPTPPQPSIQADAHSVTEGTGQSFAGQIKVFAPDGVQQVLVNHIDISDINNNPVYFQTPYGAFYLYNYDTTTGTIDYYYNEYWTASDHRNGPIGEAIPLEMIDSKGNSYTNTLHVAILDATPQSDDDYDFTYKGNEVPLTGNVIYNDTVGADGLGSVQFTSTQSQYGTFTVDATGRWTYEVNQNLDAVKNLGPDEKITETFFYTVTDWDGSQSSAQLNIDILGSYTRGPASATGNILNDDVVYAGNIAKPVNIDTEYGSFQLKPDGSYQYILNLDHPAVKSLNTGDVLVDNFSYRLAHINVPRESPVGHGTIEIHANPKSYDIYIIDPSLSFVDYLSSTNGSVLTNDTIVEDGVTKNILESDYYKNNYSNITVIFEINQNLGWDFYSDPSGYYSYSPNVYSEAITNLPNGGSFQEVVNYKIITADGRESGTGTLTFHFERSAEGTLTMRTEDSATTVAPLSLQSQDDDLSMMAAPMALLLDDDDASVAAPDLLPSGTADDTLVPDPVVGTIPTAAGTASADTAPPLHLPDVLQDNPDADNLTPLLSTLPPPAPADALGDGTADLLPDVQPNPIAPAPSAMGSPDVAWNDPGANQWANEMLQQAQQRVESI